MEGNGPVIWRKVPYGVNTLAEEVKWVFWTAGYLLFLTELLLSTTTCGRNLSICEKMGETQEPPFDHRNLYHFLKKGKNLCVSIHCEGPHFSFLRILEGRLPVLKKINCGTWFNFTAALITWKITKRTDDQIQAHCHGSMEELQLDVESTT